MPRRLAGHARGRDVRLPAQAHDLNPEGVPERTIRGRAARTRAGRLPRLRGRHGDRGARKRLRRWRSSLVPALPSLPIITGQDRPIHVHDQLIPTPLIPTPLIPPPLIAPLLRSDHREEEQTSDHDEQYPFKTPHLRFLTLATPDLTIIFGRLKRSTDPSQLLLRLAESGCTDHKTDSTAGKGGPGGPRFDARGRLLAHHRPRGRSTRRDRMTATGWSGRFSWPGRKLQPTAGPSASLGRSGGLPARGEREVLVQKTELTIARDQRPEMS
jgi:hypothetical protein